MKARKAMALTVAALALATGASTAPAAAAGTEGTQARTTCSRWKDIRVDHNAAGLRYRECDTGSGPYRRTKAQLYLWDNKHDGRIAQAHVRTGFGAGPFHFLQTWHRYYGWGNESHHSPMFDTGWHRGNDVRVTLGTPRG